MKEFFNNGGKPAKVLGGVLVVSLLVNGGVLINSLTGQDVSDEYDEDAATEISFYQEKAGQLESRNEALESQIAELEQARADAQSEATPPEETEGEASSEEASSEAPSDTEATREQVKEASTGFLQGLLNVDTSEEDNAARREKVAPYVTEEIGARIAPTPEELEEMGIVGHSHGDEEAPEDNKEAADGAEPYTYEQSISEHTLFINDASLSEDTAQVIAQVTSEISDSFGESYDVTEQYTIELTQQDGNWVVSEYTLEPLS